jgi:hypothetical protein
VYQQQQPPRVYNDPNPIKNEPQVAQQQQQPIGKYQQQAQLPPHQSAPTAYTTSEYSQAKAAQALIKTEFNDNYAYQQDKPVQQYQQYDYYANTHYSSYTNHQVHATSPPPPPPPLSVPNTVIYGLDASAPTTPTKTADATAFVPCSTVSSGYNSIDDTTTSSLLDDIIDCDEFYAQNNIYQHVQMKFNSIEQIENDLKSYCVQNKFLLS